MKDRGRGHETRQKILDEACRVFAESGYRDATHADICRAAGANIASINYHFHSKEALYREVFEYLERQVESVWPIDGSLSPSAPPERRLKAFIVALLGRIYSEDVGVQQHRILMSERFSPTGLLDDLLEAALARHRAHITGILRELLGPDATEETVLWCEMSLVGQCMIGHEDADPRGPRSLFGINAANRDRLAEHLYHFSLGGIRALKKRA
jgi:AcrR family transcriptional regulator